MQFLIIFFFFIIFFLSLNYYQSSKDIRVHRKRKRKINKEQEELLFAVKYLTTQNRLILTIKSYET